MDKETISNLVIECLNWASNKGNEGEIGDLWWNNKLSSEDLFEEFLKEYNG